MALNYFRTVIPCLALVCALAFQAVPAHAAALYNVTVDTSLINGTAGNLDFQFNPGGGSQAASADISNFTTVGGLLTGVPTLTGDVSGTLPGTVTFGNSTAFNDYFHGFTFGSSFSFLLTLYGPAIETPNGTATSGTTFGIALFDAGGTNPLLTTDPNGFAATVDINLNGSLSFLTFPPDTFNPPAVTFAEVPEPATAVLTGISLLAGCYFRRRRSNLA